MISHDEKMFMAPHENISTWDNIEFPDFIYSQFPWKSVFAFLTTTSFLWIQLFADFEVKPCWWWNTITKRGQTFTVEPFWKIGK